MNETGQQDPDPRETRVIDALRELRDAAPGDDFRARLREEFVSTGADAAGDASHPGRTRGNVVPLRRWGALAAAAAFAAIVLIANRGPAWQAVAIEGSGPVRVGERVFPAGAPPRIEELASLLRPGVEVSVEGSAQLDLLCAETIAIQLAPGSVVTLPGSPGRWFRRSVSGRVDRGEVRFVTGPAFAGAELHVDAPPAKIEVTGTTFAIIATSDSTCVCVLEGEVSINCAVVKEGRRRTVSKEMHEAVEEDLFPMERMKLEMLRDRARPLLGADRP